ncbi:hypothetical protein SASPL_126466 [Salvia splendens]|uniref:NB-ARC domain-containing protein n=1 Tax=Salvia splendens TaxID=180675 RepID=A0A8X8XJ12_SALSN|nr:hypothetical protein SASPL_126466 [Salvia splendens]
MVALDDVRNTDILIKLRRSLPEQNNGSVVLLTTGLSEVAEFDESFVLLMPPTIDEDFIWNYIQTILFNANGGIAPPGFEEIGRNIARNCGCLRLVVARIILILIRKLKKEAEDWNMLAQAQHDPVYTMDDELSEECRLTKDSKAKMDHVGAEGEKGSKECELIKVMCKQLAGDHYIAEEDTYSRCAGKRSSIGYQGPLRNRKGTRIS